LDWETILHGSAGILGDYKELAVLPDKIARILYEYHADSYISHGLSFLSEYRSNTNVHGILKAHQVCQSSANDILYSVIAIYFAYCTYCTYRLRLS
jgi:hypothetical protein